MSEVKQFTVYHISDSDELEDHIMLGMRHRDFDSVTLTLLPCDDDAFDTPPTPEGQPTRPVLLFVKGDLPSPEPALLMVQEADVEPEHAELHDLPDTFLPPDKPETIATLTIHDAYPPYPWLEAAQLGMSMGRYYDAFDLVDSSGPSGDTLGAYTYRFYNTNDAEPMVRDDDDIPDDALPF